MALNYAIRNISKLSSSLSPYLSESRSMLMYWSLVKARSKSRGFINLLLMKGCIKTKLLRWALQCQVLWSLKKPQFIPLLQNILLIWPIYHPIFYSIDSIALIKLGYLINDSPICCWFPLLNLYPSFFIISFIADTCFTSPFFFSSSKVT